MDELFVQTMQHFLTHTYSSKDNPSLLILDNHESHICIQALILAKDNAVKIQPLDVGVFGPFKVAYNKAVDSWMMLNPGKTFSIYEGAGCVKEAHMKTMTPSNICSAFPATGIFPFNRDNFTDDDFAPNEVTDRPLATKNQYSENRLNGSNRSTYKENSVTITFVLIWRSIFVNGSFNRSLIESQNSPSKVLLTVAGKPLPSGSERFTR